MAKVKIQDLYPFPLTPKRDLPRRADLEKALLVEPMEKLPEFLVPSMNLKVKMTPPGFHYGWALDDSNILLEIADKMKLPRRHQEPSDYPQEGDDDYDPDVDYDDLKPMFSVSDYIMKEDALKAVAEELKLFRTPYLAEVYNLKKGRVLMIGVLESKFIGSDSASRSDIQKLKDYFSFEDGPKWYLDSYLWTWDVERLYYHSK